MFLLNKNEPDDWKVLDGFFPSFHILVKATDLHFSQTQFKAAKILTWNVWHKFNIYCIMQCERETNIDIFKLFYM